MAEIGLLLFARVTRSFPGTVLSRYAAVSANTSSDRQRIPLGLVNFRSEHALLEAQALRSQSGPRWVRRRAQHSTPPQGQ